jgi:hypothetical protein
MHIPHTPFPSRRTLNAEVMHQYELTVNSHMHIVFNELGTMSYSEVKSDERILWGVKR